MSAFHFDISDANASLMYSTLHGIVDINIIKLENYHLLKSLSLKPVPAYNKVSPDLKL